MSKVYAVEIGKPEEKPGIIVEPIHDPVPRENPAPPVEPAVPNRKREREPVPA